MISEALQHGIYFESQNIVEDERLHCMLNEFEKSGAFNQTAK